VGKKYNYMKIKKEIVPIDSFNSTGDLAYGYSNRKEAIRDIQALEPSHKIDLSSLYRIRVMKHVKNGEDTYFWGDKCPECGTKNNGVWSYFYGNF
jgi:hypothetical protein